MVAKASAMTICVMLGVIRIVNPAATLIRGSKIFPPMRFTAGAGSQLASLWTIKSRGAGRSNLVHRSEWSVLSNTSILRAAARSSETAGEPLAV
jgi:hypothetical protein